MNPKKKQSDAVLEGMENSAISVLSRAVEHDESKRYPSALACYQEGIQLFLDVIKSTDEKGKRDRLRDKAMGYISRAEKIKEIVQKQKELETYHEQIQIQNNGTGYSYETIFKKYLDEAITKVEIEDAYIRTIHQTYNFLTFCEMLVKFCPNIKRILLTTGVNENDESNQISRFECIRESLSNHSIELIVQYSSTLHDRKITFDNGWMIKIGRGLDIFKPVKKLSIGFCDQTLRCCNETTVDIFFQNK